MMEPVNKSQLRSYYRSIRGGLTCSGKEKRVLLANLREDVSGYLAENPQAGMEEIQARFGTPEYIAANCLRDLPDGQLAGKLRVGKRIFISAMAAILAALLIWGIGVEMMVSSDFSVKNGYHQIGLDKLP